MRRGEERKERGGGDRYLSGLEEDGGEEKGLEEKHGLVWPGPLRRGPRLRLSLVKQESVPLPSPPWSSSISGVWWTGGGCVQGPGL